MDLIHVLLPDEKSIYTLFAEGNLINSFKLLNRTHLTFNAEYPILLYYTFPNHRRLYLCTRDESGITFPGIKEKLRILTQIRGRSFDRFKRSVDYLNKEYHGTIQFMPYSFFWVLSDICKKGHNDSINLDLLYQRYKYYVNDKTSV